MLRLQRMRLRARVVARPWRCQPASSSSGTATVSPSTASRRLRSPWRRRALAGASVALFLVASSHDDPIESPWRHPWLLLRCGWMLGSAFVAYTDVRGDLFGHDDTTADNEAAREARRMRWWDAITHSRPESDNQDAHDRLIWILVDLLAPSEQDADPDARRDLVRSLLERGVIEVLVDYVAIEEPTDPTLLTRIRECLELAFEEATRLQEESTPTPRLSTVRLGIALNDLIEKDMPRYGELLRLGQNLLQLERIGSDPTIASSTRSLAAPRRIDEDFGRAVSGYLRMLSPEMPTGIKEFAMKCLSTMLQAAARLPECTTTGQLSSLFSPACAALVLALPRGNDQLQQSAAALTTSLVQVAQVSSMPVHDDVYNLWMQQVRFWAQSNNSALQLASASCLRVLSSHPSTRHFVRDSPETMEALFVLARQLHEVQVKQPVRTTKKKRHKQPKPEFEVPSLFDQVERALIQKHLSKAFLNVCTSYQSGGTAILETMSSGSDTFHTKRRLPMSEVFRVAQDVMDLPVYGAEEYDASTEFGWADILTQWTGSSDRDIRRNAIGSLVHLVDQDSDSEEGVKKQQLLLQAWLASMLQHVRNITGGEEILAIKQVEKIARISDEFTPGNEKIVFNPAVVDAGASALAILAEQHYDELIHYGVVPLMSLLATKSPTDTRFDFATQSARVIANLIAACSKTLESHHSSPHNDLLSSTVMAKSSMLSASFIFNHTLWKTFFAEVFDIGQMLESNSSGLKLLQIMKTWREREDPYERSQLYRALANLAAYREMARAGTRLLPMYAEGVHPIVPHGDVSDDIAALAESDVDVVFVHSLRGDAFGTWRTNMSDAIDARTDVWPDVLLYEDLKNMGIRARILSLGYEAGMVSWSSPWPSLTLQERAKLMLDALYAAQVGDNLCLTDTTRPVVFVTHSMGGILVKKMLLQSKANDEDSTRYRHSRSLADCTKGIVFLAVPHFGSDLARGARSEAVRSLLRTHPAIQDLCASHDRRLEILNDSFAELHIDCLSIAEQKPAPLGFGLSAMVVKPDSANPGIGSFFVLPNADHMTICKAKHHDDPMYQSVLEYVTGCISAATHRQ